MRDGLADHRWSKTSELPYVRALPERSQKS
jgi:hypothetical protein